jgi:ribosomal protein S12 methylthiotransferase accessory factor
MAGMAMARHPIQGAGVGLDDKEAQLRARGEALERYCSSVFKKEQFVVATAEELGHAAVDLDTIPRCSALELANPLCPLIAPDKKKPIRWVRGISLLDGRLVYLPVVLVYLYPAFLHPGERICFIISTGCAGHPSLERALVSATLEVIERDAISITWLQQLPLPRIEIDHVSPILASYWERYQQGSKESECIFFDATTDLGVPTVYSLQVSQGNARAATLVSCSTALDPTDAVLGAMREMASGRAAFRQPRQTPEKVEDFSDIFHGATYMARAENAGGFDFLKRSTRRRLLSEMPSLASASDKQALEMVTERLRQNGLEAFAVELSTDEALRSGVRVVRVVIPGLQPLSFSYRARYLGHPRLYNAPRKMGYRVHEESELNPWPQPFA